MTKRVMTGVLAGGLMLALLPAAVSAAPPGSRQDGSPRIERTVTCEVKGGNFDGGSLTATFEGPSGAVQEFAAKALRDFFAENGGGRCAPGTQRISTERVPGDDFSLSLTIIIVF